MFCLFGEFINFFFFFLPLFLLPSPTFAYLLAFFFFLLTSLPLLTFSFLLFSSSRNATATSSTAGTSSAASPRIPSVYGVRSGG